MADFTPQHSKLGWRAHPIACAQQWRIGLCPAPPHRRPTCTSRLILRTSRPVAVVHRSPMSHYTECPPQLARLPTLTQVVAEVPLNFQCRLGVSQSPRGESQALSLWYRPVLELTYHRVIEIATDPMRRRNGAIATPILLVVASCGVPLGLHVFNAIATKRTPRWSPRDESLDSVAECRPCLRRTPMSNLHTSIAFDLWLLPPARPLAFLLVFFGELFTTWVH